MPMNDAHLTYLVSDEWRAVIEHDLLPWTLQQAELGDHLLEIGRSRGEIVHADGAQRAAVERVDRIVLRDHPIETGARPLELSFVEIQMSELFVVAD